MPDIESIVHQVLIEELGVEASELLPEADLIDDLGCDSLDISSIAVELEEQLPITISDEDFEESEVKTVQQLIDFVSKKAAVQKGTSP